MEPIRVALIGDHNPDVTAHRAIPIALALAARELDVAVEPAWLHTAEITGGAGQLDSFDAFWCVPASPYARMDGALSAIRYARETPRPFLGTCGGFQHALIEYARDVLGVAGADHAESNPGAEIALIAPLSCALVEQSGDILLREGSRVARLYGRTRVVEQYHCSYGLDAQHRALFAPSALRIVGEDLAGEARAVELDEHPYFLATLFQPERSALEGRLHPLIVGLISAAIANRPIAAASSTRRGKQDKNS